MTSSDRGSEGRPGATPAQLRELVAEAEALAARIDERQAALRADSNEHRRRAGFRLDEAAGAVRAAGRDLEATAGELARIAAVLSQPANPLSWGACRMPWGCCPDHGNTLSSSGGRTWCNRPGCDRAWNHDRLAGPCPDPVTHQVRDAEGTILLCCTGHAIGAQEQLVGATVTTIPAGKTPRGSTPDQPDQEDPR